MAQVPDIAYTEQRVVKTTLRERYGRVTPFELAEADIRLHHSDRELARGPGVFRQGDDGCSFILFMTGEKRCRCQLFYKAYKRMGTGIESCDDLAECTLAVLQDPADYPAEQRGDLLGRDS